MGICFPAVIRWTPTNNLATCHPSLGLQLLPEKVVGVGFGGLTTEPEDMGQEPKRASNQGQFDPEKRRPQTTRWGLHFAAMNIWPSVHVFGLAFRPFQHTQPSAGPDGAWDWRGAESPIQRPPFQTIPRHDLSGTGTDCRSPGVVDWGSVWGSPSWQVLWSGLDPTSCGWPGRCLVSSGSSTDRRALSTRHPR